MAEEVAHSGTASVTVARVIARARVSRRLFYELFADVEDCLLATFEWGVELARSVVLDACRDEGNWIGQMRAGLAALLRFFDAQPLLAQLCIVQSAGGGRSILRQRSAVIAELAAAVALGGERARSERPPPPVVSEGVVGAVLAVLYSRVLGRQAGADGESQAAGTSPLIELYGELMSMIVLPYRGPKAAAKEIDRPPPPAPESLSAASNPIAVPASEHAGARLTYRTVRVLRAIAELPAASNREVAEHADVVDQGQISKILTRLECQGLVVNRGGKEPAHPARAARGAPNSWWLTERGEALERDLRDRPYVPSAMRRRSPSRGARR